MPRKSKLTDEERIAAVQEYLDGKGSYAAIAKRYGINHGRFRQMVIRAKVDGIDAVKIRHTKQLSQPTKCNRAIYALLQSFEMQTEKCQKPAF